MRLLTELVEQVLIVDDNLIQTINSSTLAALTRLEVFHAARNSIDQLPVPGVNKLRRLRDIDVSENELRAVPAELLALPKLEVPMTHSVAY